MEMDEVVRDVEWCEAEIRAGRPIRGERIHLTRKIAGVGPFDVQRCHITADFDGWWPFESPAPEVVAIFDEHGFRPGPRGQN